MAMQNYCYFYFSIMSMLAVNDLQVFPLFKVSTAVAVSAAIVA